MNTNQTVVEELPEISLYDWLAAHDLITWFRPLWEQGGWTLRNDGKLHFAGHSMAINTPWVHIKNDWRLDCATWHRLIFDYVANRQPEGSKFVPSRCHECWKTVVRPKTLKQLFALEDLQRKMDRPSKCGIEVRNTVHGLYGGYFYGVGFKEGCDNYRAVRQAINENKYLGPDVQVILKRGCTEFELAVGPSDKWAIHPKQLEIESMIERWVAKDDWNRVQPDVLIWAIKKNWIEYAYAHGDPTYAEFTGGRPLTKPYVTYQHLAESPDYPNNIISKQLNPSVSDNGIGAEQASEEKNE